MKIDIKSLVLGALLAIVIFVSVGAAPDGPSAWEYKVVTGRVYGGEKLETVINNYVAQGWHFISASGVGDSSGFAVMRRERN